MPMKKALRAVLILLTVIICLLAASCGKVPPSPQSIVTAICSAEAPLPVGRLYYSDAPEGSEEYLPFELLSDAYGVPFDYDGIEKAAVRLSANGHPAETAVFLCKNGNAAEDVALFCRSRISTLSRNALFSSKACGMALEEYESYLASASVTVSGRYVCLIISSDPAEARRAFLGAL